MYQHTCITYAFSIWHTRLVASFMGNHQKPAVHEISMEEMTPTTDCHARIGGRYMACGLSKAIPGVHRNHGLCSQLL